MTEAAHDRSAPGVLHFASTAVTLVSNLIPLAGVLFWGWDTFQLLMLYWMETVVLAFWTMRRLAQLPAGQTGTMTVDDKERPATNSDLVRFFTFHAGMFIAAHLLFLWALFSSEWLKKVHGLASFFYELFVANGLWFALLFFLVAGWVAFHTDARPGFQQRLEGKLEGKLESTRLVEQARKKTGNDGVGAVVGALYVRIFVMQIAIIFGAWFAEAIGSLAPLLLVIVLKTVVDLGVGSNMPLGKGATYSSGSTSIGT